MAKTKIGTMTFGFTVWGPDLAALAACVVRHPALASVPDRLRVDGREKRGDSNWTAEIVKTKSGIAAQWGEAGTQSFSYVTDSIVSAVIPDVPLDPRAAIEILQPLPFEIASFTSIHEQWYSIYTPPGFGDYHALLGWGCAFRGAGHDRLVSRRWLEYGPWRLIRSVGDLSLVQFHDLAAPANDALAQARPGHKRMGIGETGGFLQSPYVYSHDVSGIYVANERKLYISAADREVSQIEMRDACAVRRRGKTKNGEPLEKVAFIWIDEKVARRHLHELWLRDLECWAIVGGQKVRLDEGYAPVPSKPDWVMQI